MKYFYIENHGPITLKLKKLSQGLLLAYLDEDGKTKLSMLLSGYCALVGNQKSLQNAIVAAYDVLKPEDGMGMVLSLAEIEWMIRHQIKHFDFLFVELKTKLKKMHSVTYTALGIKAHVNEIENHLTNMKGDVTKLRGMLGVVFKVSAFDEEKLQCGNLQVSLEKIGEEKKTIKFRRVEDWTSYFQKMIKKHALPLPSRQPLAPKNASILKSPPVKKKEGKKVVKTVKFAKPKPVGANFAVCPRTGVPNPYFKG